MEPCVPQEELAVGSEVNVSEVDGVVYLHGGTGGDVVKARIGETLAYEKEGQIVHG